MAKPQRTCIGCRETKDQEELVRYVLAPDGGVVADVYDRLPGRGCYTCFTPDCLDTAVARKQFDRTFRGKNRPVSADLLRKSINDQVLGKVLNLIGMARKAGLVTGGSNQVLAALTAPVPPKVVVRAADMSSSIAEKLEQRTRARNVPLHVLFDRETLGRCVGREVRSVLAFQTSGLSERLLAEIERYTELVGE